MRSNKSGSRAESRKDSSWIYPLAFASTLKTTPTDADVGVLPRMLEDFNESRWPGHQPWKPLGVFVRDRESVVAGLVGETYCGWLFIRYLWVSDSLRGQGIGRKLMGGGEDRALERGCHSAWVDTFGFQAPGFYRQAWL